MITDPNAVLGALAGNLAAAGICTARISTGCPNPATRGVCDEHRAESARNIAAGIADNPDVAAVHALAAEYKRTMVGRPRRG